MAIQIGGTAVIADDKGIQFITGLRSGTASTVSPGFGAAVGINTSTYNIGDGRTYQSGDPNLAAPTDFSGAIIVDGTVFCQDFTTTLSNEL